MKEGRVFLLYLGLFTLLLTGLLSRPAAALSVRDDTGHVVTLAAPAQRIVSLAPHITELLFAAGAGARVVGVSAYSDFPAAARSVPQVGGASGLDLEAILALHPDLVVAWAAAGQREQVARLQAMGIPVYWSDPRHIADIADSLQRLGRLAGTEAVARREAARLRRGFAALDQRYRQRRAVRVFYEIWPQPLMTVNGQHMISAVLRLCGARNVFAKLPTLVATVGTEAVLAADPQVIFAAGRDGQAGGWLTAWRRWPQLAAVRTGQLDTLPADLIQRAGPRLLQGARLVCRAIQRAREHVPPAGPPPKRAR